MWEREFGNEINERESKIVDGKWGKLESEVLVSTNKEISGMTRDWL